jgi:nitroreductase/NAD-dependent dihydropyrimidine dehydrogenase PreA subunit
MSLLTIDVKKCKKDGICVIECPRNIIQLGDEDGYPQSIPGGEKMCILCGHCVAVCPNNALNNIKIPIEVCPPIEKSLSINENQSNQFLRSRRAIRNYEDKPVENDKIQKLIDISRYAPNAGNTQMVEWVVVNDKDKVHKIAEETADWIREILNDDPAKVNLTAGFLKFFLAAWDSGQDSILRNAPALIVAMAPKKSGSGIMDPVIALAYLELAAPVQGLGTCWAGLMNSAMVNSSKIRSSVGIPEDYPYFYPMMLGYPRFKFYRLPERNQSKIIWR